MLQREILGATRERMLREIGEAMETIASEKPLLLVLEDLHWADASTIDFISAMARRRAPARLMLIGTYRPADVKSAEHPLEAVKQDLLVHRLCHEIVLQPLEEVDVAEYLGIELGGAAVPEGLAGLIHRYTGGNPLFMRAVLEHMQDRGLITAENESWHIETPLEKIDLEAPENLWHMIELQIERLSEEEQQVLEIASVLRKFSLSVTLGAAVSNLEADTVEDFSTGLLGGIRLSVRQASEITGLVCLPVTNLYTRCIARSCIAESGPPAGKNCTRAWPKISRRYRSSPTPRQPPSWRSTSNWVGIGCAPSGISSSRRISPEGGLNLDKPHTFLSTPWSW